MTDPITAVSSTEESGTPSLKDRWEAYQVYLQTRDAGHMTTTALYSKMEVIDAEMMNLSKIIDKNQEREKQEDSASGDTADMPKLFVTF